VDAIAILKTEIEVRTIEIFKYIHKNYKKHTNTVFEFLDASLYNKLIDEETCFIRKRHYEDILGKEKEQSKEKNKKK